MLAKRLHHHAAFLRQTQPAKTPCIDPEGLVCHHCKLQRPKHYYDASTIKNRNKKKTQFCNACKGTNFCTSCTTWKSNTDFRPGAECCKLCQLIKCAGCGENKMQSEYSKRDRENFFNAVVNVLCQQCHKAGKSINQAEHKVYKGAHSKNTSICRECGVSQPPKAFRRTKGSRIDVCRTCE